MKVGEAYEWQDVSPITIVLNADNKWKDSFTDLESKVPLELPASKNTPDVDVEYQIVETQVNGKSLTEAGVTAHKIEQNASTNGYSYTVTNTVEANTGDLELLKTVTGKVDTATQFEFEISLVAPANVALASSYNGTVAEASRTFTVTEGKISGIMLKNGEKAVINGLPSGTQYAVEEINIPKGFDPTWIKQNGTIPNSSGAKVSVSAENVFTAEANTTFSVKKNFIGGNLNDMQFTFKLTQVDADNSTTPVTTKLANPVTVTTDRAAGTEQTMSFALPEDFKFTQDDIGKTFWFMIEEEVPEEARTSPFIAEGVKYANPCQQWVSVTISESAGALVVTKSTTEEQPDAEFTNEQLGKLIVTKTYAGNAADNLTDQQKQAITFSIDGPNGFNDIAEMPLSHESFKKGADGAYTLTLNNIPLGEYTVTEMKADIDGYTRVTTYAVNGGDSATGEEAVIILSDSLTTGNVAFTNDYTKHTQYTPKVDKVLKVGEDIAPTSRWPEAGFSFKLAALDSTVGGSTLVAAEVPMPENTTATVKCENVVDGLNGTGTIRQVKTTDPAFGAITYTVAGTYYYQITEAVPQDAVSNRLNGITYDATPVNVRVVVTKNDSGELVVTSVTYGSVTATEGIEDATATVVNTIETTEFEFNKKWFGDALSTTAIGWPTGVASIEVTIGRRLKYQADAVTVDETTAWTNPDDGFSKVYTLTQTTGMGAGLPDLTVTSANNIYKYVLKGLDKYGVFEGHQGEWEYFVSETRQNAYTTIFRDENGERLDGATSARNGGTIENRLITVSLPATGGRGTTTIYIAGAALLLQAILGFILRRKAMKEID